MVTDFVTYSGNTELLFEERAIKKLKNRILSYSEFYDEYELDKMNY